MTTRVRKLNEVDFERVKSFMLQHFYGHDPLFQSLDDEIKYTGTPERWAERLEIIREGFSLAAVDEEDRILGIALNSVVLPNDLEKKWQKVKEKKPTDALSHRMYFFYKTEWDSQIFQRFGVSRALDYHLLCVDPILRRQGLGTQLNRAVMKTARSNGFPLMFGTSVNHYSTKTLVGQGWRVVNTAKYADYKDEHGNTPIRPRPPHTEINVVAIKFLNKLVAKIGK